MSNSQFKGRVQTRSRPTERLTSQSALRTTCSTAGTGASGQILSEGDFFRERSVSGVEFGIIAGNKGQKITFSESNDGLIAVEATKLEGMSDPRLLFQSSTLTFQLREIQSEGKEGNNKENGVSFQAIYFS